jgi:GTP-binding protein YchF
LAAPRQLVDLERPMSLRCGITGLPNVGKSTIFNALTAAGIAAENYPFCTIEPNSGVVAMPDPRLAALDELVNSARVVPAIVEFTDIAGLVAGASKGEGLGNKFLAHIRETDAIIHVTRCFEDENVVHVEGSLDSLRDVETIDTELALADIETLDRRTERARKASKAGDKQALAETAFFEGLLAHVSNGQPARTFDVPDAQRVAFRDCHLITAKPVLFVANVDDASLLGGNQLTAALEDHVAEIGAGLIRLCGKVEAELSELDEDSAREFLAELGIEDPGLHRLIRAAFELLGLITFFTASEKEVKAWTIRRGTAAPQAAGVIHSDFERHFIRAEVTSFDDFVNAGGEAGARSAGSLRIEGKDYVMRDGDVVHFRVGV